LHQDDDAGGRNAWRFGEVELPAGAVRDAVAATEIGREQKARSDLLGVIEIQVGVVAILPELVGDCVVNPSSLKFVVRFV
jgi:hypothetical protein